MKKQSNICFKVLENQHNDHNLIDRYLQAYDITPPSPSKEFLSVSLSFYLLFFIVFWIHSLIDCTTWTFISFSLFYCYEIPMHMHNHSICYVKWSLRKIKSMPLCLTSFCFDSQINHESKRWLTANLCINENFT